MKFNVSTQHVVAAHGEGTTVYCGTIYVNGEIAAQDGNAELGTDRDMDGLLWNYVAPYMARKLGRELTEEEEDAINETVEQVTDGSGSIREGEEYTFEVGSEPGGGGENPKPEFVQTMVRPQWKKLVAALLNICDDPDEDWVGRGFDPRHVRELDEWTRE